MKFFCRSLLGAGLLLGWASGSAGHAPLDYATMKPRVNASNVKTSIAGIDDLPCGPGANAVPGPAAHQIVAGSDFEVVFIETVDHPAKYLIDLTSQDVDMDPLSLGNPNQLVLMDQDGFYNDSMMPQDMDNIQDRVQNPRSTSVNNPNPNAVYRVMVQIPEDVTCEKCTLRLMQKMFDNNTLRNTVYTHCTDVSIANSGANDPSEAMAPEPMSPELMSPELPAAPSGLKIEMTPRPVGDG